MKRLLYAFLIIFGVLDVLNAAQPPFQSRDAEDQNNFDQIYSEMGTHHLSSRDVIPDRDSTRNLGRSGTEWATLHVDSITVTNPGSLIGYKVGTFTSSSSTQAITGIGFRPRLVIIGFGLGDVDSFRASLGWGTGSGSTEQQSVFSTVITAGDAGGLPTDAGYIIKKANHTDPGGTALVQGALVSMDSDGFSIYWSIASATVMAYIAFQ